MLTLNDYIDQLKNQNDSTRQMYQKLAYTLFTEYGEIPTTTRLYELLRKGSMSMVTEEIKLFWQNIQQAWHQRLQLPNIPKDLQNTYIANLEQLWQHACGYANDLFVAQKLDLEEKLTLNKQALENLQHAHQTLNIDYSQLHQNFDSFKIQAEQINTTLQKELQQINTILNDTKEAYQQLQALNKQQSMDFNNEKTFLLNNYEEKQAQLFKQIQHWQTVLDQERTNFKQQENQLRKDVQQQQQQTQVMQANYLDLKQQQLSWETLNQQQLKQIALLEQQIKQMQESQYLQQLQNQKNLQLSDKISFKMNKNNKTSSKLSNNLPKTNKLKKR